MDPPAILQVQESFASLGNVLPITEELFPELFPRYVYHQHRIWINGREWVADLEIPREVLDYHRDSGVVYPGVDYLKEYKPRRGSSRFLKTPKDTRVRVIHFPTYTRTILKTVFFENHPLGTGSINPRLTLKVSIDIFSTSYRVASKVKRLVKKVLRLTDEVYGEVCDSDFLFGEMRTGGCPRVIWQHPSNFLDSRRVYSPEFHHGTFEIRTRDNVDWLFTKEEALDFIFKTHLGKIFDRVV